ncbi:MAG: hypothetical protein F6J93_39960 [Oscillatoria sp. SIO1A7]|nr:hypothetical protein [Oscillatoria sp. SIO1A7]
MRNSLTVYADNNNLLVRDAHPTKKSDPMTAPHKMGDRSSEWPTHK